MAESDLLQRQVTDLFGSFRILLHLAVLIAVAFRFFGLILETNRGVEGACCY